MTTFQLIALPLFSVLALSSLVQVIRGRGRRRVALAMALVWIVAGLAIAFPESTTAVARWLGIGRGADLVTYLLASAFMATTVYFYHRYRQLSTELTKLVRHVAIAEAESPDAPGPTGKPEDTT